MILCKLKLENFKKYSYYSMEFNQGLIGIIGKNGSGKSTIFEAILFALYGELKNKGYKEVIRNANATTKDAVVVELDFEFEGIEYRVSREFRGKALSANAKFYKTDELITTGAKEVTASIINLTKMSKDAFLHTLFASQKELTSLSSLKNEDRKKMIRKLLGLEKIDFIEKELVEKSRELKREIAAFAEVLLSDEEVQSKTEHIQEYKNKTQDLETDVELRAKEVDSIKLLELDIKKELESYQKSKEQKQDLYSKCELLKSTINSHIQRQSNLSEEVSKLELKQTELRGLESVKSEYVVLHDKLKEQDKLKEYYIRKQSLVEEQTNLREHYTKSRDTIRRLENETSQHQEFAQKEKEFESQLEELQKQLESLNNKERELLNHIAGEEKLIKDINSKIDNIKNLGAGSDCPTCTRPLLDEYDSVLASLECIVNNTQRDKIEIAKQECKEIQKSKKTYEDKKTIVSKEHFELSKTINLMESKKRDLQKENEHFEKVEAQGLKNKEELFKLESYEYDKKTHEDLLEEQKELKSKYEYVLSLETMLQRLDSIKEELKQTSTNIEKLNNDYNEKELEYKSVNYDEVKHKQKQKESDEVSANKEKKLNQLNELKVQIATIQGQIKTIQQSLDNNSIQLAKVQDKKDDLIDYEKIKISLGDFKTKLNAKVAPRISDIASNMYSLITKGKYQHIEVSNDFDFYIYDEGRKFPIERFSGGEVDLANLVLRIAISKTLTELSGASSIGFLAFDEVFGSQDEARRMEILEAFHTIKEQYRQIFLISHEMEIKEMFESVVEL
ncbi:AAA family ATPase [Poseidonibacter lekithochrous]|uniref:AAA family ATPase n=1 Tax=Poseidonibacter lekithochrous TaxID=1904463 RepID=UPI0008FCCEEE|nr:SMC family ATPase [Poseidonibacter lekithochrous]QKJ23309.1 SbcCD-like exonuclease, ATPase subunit [Poseidonibacter lekithochrous]